MRGQTITFDGHRLNDRFFVGEVNVGLPDFVPNLEDKATGDGSVFRNMRLGSVDITVALVTRPVRGETARDALSDLLAWLDVDEPKALALSGDRGLWRMAVPSGAPQIGDAEWQDKVTVTFTQPDPILYGIRREVTVPSGGTLSFAVGGDYPTKPTISSDAAVRNASTRQWGVRLDDGDIMRVAVPLSSASTVRMDCDARTCAVNGATTIPTINSDWFELKPGTHTIRNDMGAGACTVSWYERWHR